MSYYGIDLGTTYSCIARANDKGEVEIIKNMEGKNITPSVVEFESPTKVIVGETAKESVMINPENVVQYIKRSMGDTNYSFTHQGVKFTPEEISAHIIRKLVEDAETATNEKITEVVITVPAYFGFDERQATKNAGIIAGLNVLEVVNEPTAAAIAYGSNKSDDNQSKIVLVYDLGGGTFDITVAEMIGDEVKVICTEGDHNLGGKDWDTDLAAYVISEFCEETEATEDEVTDDPEFFNDLLLKVEDAKKQLSSKSTAKIALSLGTHKARIEVSLDKFNELTRGRLLNTINLTKSVIETAASKTSSKGVPCNQYDGIIFVGGSTRMLQVKDEIIKEFRVEPVVFEPDEAVAKGAALLAKYIKENPSSSTSSASGTAQLGAGSKKFGEVTSKAYGLEALVNGVTKISNLIMQNNEIPCSNTDIFGTASANQTSANIVIYESNSQDNVCDLSFGKKVNESDLELPPGLPQDSPIEVTFSIDSSGILFVTAIEKNSGKKIEVQTKTSGLDTDEVKKLQSKMQATLVE